MDVTNSSSTIEHSLRRTLQRSVVQLSKNKTL